MHGGAHFAPHFVMRERNAEMKQQTLQVGQIVNTHGLRGEVKVVPWTDTPDVFEDLETVYIDIKKEKKAFALQHIKYQKGNLIVKFAGIDHIDEAETLKNHTLYVDREQLGEPEEGYYICDLLGCSVETDEGKHLGKVVEVFPTGSNDVYVVRPEKGKDILLPVIDEVVLCVDIEEGKIMVHLLEGLVE